jgi:hypothetical protein
MSPIALWRENSGTGCSPQHPSVSTASVADAPYSTLHDVQEILHRLDPAPKDPSAQARRPDRMLAALLDLPGAVRVADHLATMPRDAFVPLEGEAGASPIRARIDKKMRDLRQELALSFEDPFEGRRAAPSAARLREVLLSTGAFPARTEATIAAAARTLAIDVRERFDHQHARGQQRVRWARVDVTAELRALGPVAARIETLDQVVSRATEASSAKLKRELERRLDDVFADALARAVAALPDTESPETESWVARGGFIDRHVRALFTLCLVLVDADIDALLALVDSAWAHRQQEIDA